MQTTDIGKFCCLWLLGHNHSRWFPSSPNRAKLSDHAGGLLRLCPIENPASGWEEQVHASLRTAHRRSRLEKNRAELLLLFQSVHVQGIINYHLEGRIAMEICSMEEKEGPGICSTMGWGRNDLDLQRAQS